jgi:hypothetical protein
MGDFRLNRTGLASFFKGGKTVFPCGINYVYIFKPRDFFREILYFFIN